MAKPRQASHPVAQRPFNEAQLLSQATRFLQGGSDWQARVLCLQVLQPAPRHAQAHYLLGLIAARAGAWPSASPTAPTTLPRATTWAWRCASWGGTAKPPSTSAAPWR
jgi:hypothetical protein